MGDEERWAPVPGFDGRYLVSTRGRVVSAPDEKGLHEGKPLTIQEKGRARYVLLTRPDGIRVNYAIGRLVLRTFVGKAPGQEVVVYRDFNASNCRLENLGWLVTDLTKI